MLVRVLGGKREGWGRGEVFLLLLFIEKRISVVLPGWVGWWESTFFFVQCVLCVCVCVCVSICVAMLPCKQKQRYKDTFSFFYFSK